MQDLLTSIPLVGIIENLVVEQEGENFRILAGHRRWVAARALRMVTVPCMVYAPGTAPRSAIQHHENKVREDLNPAEEGRYFTKLLDAECEGDVDKLCLLVKEARGYVEGRLLLVSGWPQVIEALGLNFISFGVAQELNRITDEPTMLMYLDAAARGGATVRMVREWRTQWERTQQYAPEALEDSPLAGAAVQIPAQTTMKCFLCDSEESPHDMELLFTHRTCRRMLLDNWLARLRGDAPQEG